MQGSIIAFPVGRFGVNQADDVEQIQKLLNRAIASRPELKASGIAPLDVDGDCGSKTIGAIEADQLKMMKWSGRACDATIHPNRATWKSLNGNIGTLRELRPMHARMPAVRAAMASASAASAAKAASPAVASAGAITAFKQGVISNKE